MINAIVNALVYSIPWWVQLGVALLIALAILYYAIRVFGFERVKGWIVPVLAVLAALGILSKARQQGYQDRKDIQKKAQDDALNDFKQTEQTIDNKPISEVDKENEKWLKP